MVKVKCKICGCTGYTAAPKTIICKCGGRFRVLREKREDRLAPPATKLESWFGKGAGLPKGSPAVLIKGLI